MNDKVIPDPEHNLHYCCSALSGLDERLLIVYRRLHETPHADLARDALVLARQVGALYARVHETAGWGRPQMIDLPDELATTQEMEHGEHCINRTRRTDADVELRDTGL